MATIKASATMRKGGKTSWFKATIKPKISTTANSTKITGTIQLTSTYDMDWSGRCNLQYKLSSKDSYKDGDDLTISMTGSTSKDSGAKSFSITINSVLKNPTIYFRLDLTRTTGTNGQTGVYYIGENTNWTYFTFHALDFDTKIVSSPPDIEAYVDDDMIYIEGDTYTSIQNDGVSTIKVPIHWQNTNSNDPVHVEINYKSRGIDTSGFSNEEFVGRRTIFGSASGKISTRSGSYNLPMIPGRRYSIRIIGTSYSGDSDKTSLYAYVSCGKPKISYDISEVGLDYVVIGYSSTGNVIPDDAIDNTVDKNIKRALINRLFYRVNGGILQISKNSDDLNSGIRDNGKLYISSLKPSQSYNVNIYGRSTTFYNEKDSDRTDVKVHTHEYNSFSSISGDFIHGTNIDIPIVSNNTEDPMELYFYIVKSNTDGSSEILQQLGAIRLLKGYTGSYNVSLSEEIWDKLYQNYNRTFDNIRLYGALYMVSEYTGKKYSYLVDNNIKIPGTNTYGEFITNIKFTGIQKTTKVKVNGEWKRAQAWVKVDGEWKRAVPWVKTNGEWKRTL